MPRPNRLRSVQAEGDLAQRIAWERESRGWTNEGLAKRMTDAGCAIQPSAIYKIEKADPPRRITVNELVALATVFGKPIADLLNPPDSLSDREVTEGVLRAEVAVRELNAAVAHVERLVADDPDRRVALRNLLGDWSDWPEVRNPFRYALSGKGKQMALEPQPERGPARVTATHQED